MTDFLRQLKPDIRLYDRTRDRERVVQAVEPMGPSVYLSLRDPKTGEVERLPFVVANLPQRFDVVSGEFGGSPALVRLVAEAHRLNHAYLFNPVFATETSLIEPLSHQLAAVYGIPAEADHPHGVPGLLSLPRLRFLLADDAGAGKTIMAGLYIREMLLRRLVRRVLIIPPAGLVGNWEKELRTLFRLRFRILDSSDVKEDDNPFARNDLAILSVDTARQERVRAALRDAPAWDLVICDDAHKLSARRNPDLSPDKSRRYETAEEIARRCQHLLLLTATPHMGKDDPYFFLWHLMDPQQFSTPLGLHRARPEVRRRHLLRRMKEEMVRFDGENLYPPRKSKTVSYPLNPDEQALYEMVTSYVEENYRKTTTRNRSSVGLALTVIQRRLASSTWALLQSLERREAKLSGDLKRLEGGLISSEEYDAEQNDLPTKDLREEKTADEEGYEEAEEFDAEVSGATAARSAAELRAELVQLRTLVEMARTTYEKQRESKFERLQALLKDYPDTKILVFTEHRDTLSFLVARMEGLGYTDRIATIHGGMDYRERERQVERFRNPDCPYLIATDAAGEGINLQFCWLLINYDIPWNPARLEQRMGRVHRYRQNHEVLLLSLVAEETREGIVLKTLLDKLELIRERLGDKVFDMIGEQLSAISLSDLLFGMVARGEDALARVNEAADLQRFAEGVEQQKQRVELSEVRVLLEALKRGQEAAEERRMMPAYVRGFFEEAAGLVGLRLKGDLNGIFAMEEAPETVWRAMERAYPPALVDRLTFARELALPASALTLEAIYLHPGEVVFEAVMDLFLGRFENDASRGAVLYDAAAEGPYLFVLAKVAVVRPLLDADGQVTEDRETLGEEMTGVVLREDGTARAAPAHLLLTLELDGAGDAPALPETLLGLTGDAAAVEGFVLEEKGVPLLERIQGELRGRLPERENQLVQAFNLRQAEAMQQRRRLREDVAKGIPAAKSKLEALERELSGLENARDGAIAALHREVDLVDFSPVTIYARALVLPLPAAEAKRRRDVQAEQVAIGMARAFEEGLGGWVEDVSDPNLACGYDLRSHRPDGSVRYIEVKGRAGVTPVELTENEWRQAANHREKYWLYTVYGCETETPQMHRIADPFGNLLAKSGGVLVAAADVVGAAER